MLMLLTAAITASTNFVPHLPGNYSVQWAVREHSYTRWILSKKPIILLYSHFCLPPPTSRSQAWISSRLTRHWKLSTIFASKRMLLRICRKTLHYTVNEQIRSFQWVPIDVLSEQKWHALTVNFTKNLSFATAKAEATRLVHGWGNELFSVTRNRFNGFSINMRNYNRSAKVLCGCRATILTCNGNQQSIPIPPDRIWKTAVLFAERFTTDKLSPRILVGGKSWISYAHLAKANMPPVKVATLDLETPSVGKFRTLISQMVQYSVGISGMRFSDTWLEWLGFFPAQVPNVVFDGWIQRQSATMTNSWERFFPVIFPEASRAETKAEIFYCSKNRPVLNRCQTTDRRLSGEFDRLTGAVPPIVTNLGW